MASRNRTAGHALERKIMHDMREFFPNCKTSRNESRTLDAKKIDLTDTGEFAFQVKLSATRVPYDKILEEMDTDAIKVIINNLTEKKGKKFMTKGKYAIMQYNDFIELLRVYLNSIKTEAKRRTEILMSLP